MKIILIYPPYSALLGGYKKYGIVNRDIPLGLPSLSAYLKQEGHDVSILDLNIKMYLGAAEEAKELWHRKNLDFWGSEQLFLNKVLPRLEKIEEKWVNTILQSNPGIIGFYISYISKWMALSLAKRLKEKNKDIVVIFGGPDCFRENAESFLETGDVDAVVIGEGEITLSQLVDSYEKTGRLQPCPGVVLRDNGKIVYGGKREAIKDLDALPYPDFSGFIDDYKALFGDEACLSISWVRGCTHRCAFCYESQFWGQPRARSPESICREFIFQKEKYKVNVFFKGDSILAISEKQLLETCDFLIEKKADVYWSSQSRLENYLTPESLEKLHRAGCCSLGYGLESGSQAVVDRLNKGFQVKAAQGILINTKQAGIRPNISIMVGSPGETITDFLKTIWFILRNRNFIDDIFVSSAGIMTTTDWYLHPEKYGIVMGKKLYYNWRTKDYFNNRYARTIKRYTLEAVSKALS